MFDAQPNRAFSYSLSFHAGQYRLYMYDHAGGVYSRSYDLHESPLLLLRILCATTFAPASWLGMDDTFDCRLHPVITVDATQYFIIAKCFSSSVIRGQATNVWFVAKSIPAGSDPNNIFVVKDSWVNVERQLSEEQILEALKDVECVLKVKEAWTVQWDGQDDSTSLCRPAAFMSHFQRPCDHRTRRRLILTPAGRPITHAASPLEVVTCLLDLVIAHKRIWLLGILHRDISINNAMMYEEVLLDGTVRVRGLLVDFDYATKVDGSNCTVGPGDRMVSSGTLPFMAVELLRAVNNKPVKHTVAHDLESFVYLLCWIVTFFAGPESRLRKDSTKLAIEGWYTGNDLLAFANNKEGCMVSASHLEDITSYYRVLSACVGMLSELVRCQLYAQCLAHGVKLEKGMWGEWPRGLPLELGGQFDPRGLVLPGRRVRERERVVKRALRVRRRSRFV
ncbi:hypothetical protein EDD15DRAFT_2173804 [Pisolithus albus]|nr:hypothetical protein EDD15DRAFT_2173804 [Pisolithus albus]